MTEYDFSEEAYTAYTQKQAEIGDWASSVPRRRRYLVNPEAAPTPSPSVLREVEDADEPGARRHRRTHSHDGGGDGGEGAYRARHKSHERDAEREEHYHHHRTRSRDDEERRGRRGASREEERSRKRTDSQETERSAKSRDKSRRRDPPLRIDIPPPMAHPLPRRSHSGPARPRTAPPEHYPVSAEEARAWHQLPVAAQPHAITPPAAFYGQYHQPAPMHPTGYAQRGMPPMAQNQYPMPGPGYHRPPPHLAIQPPQHHRSYSAQVHAPIPLQTHQRSHSFGQTPQGRERVPKGYIYHPGGQVAASPTSAYPPPMHLSPEVMQMYASQQPQSPTKEPSLIKRMMMKLARPSSRAGRPSERSHTDPLETTKRSHSASRLPFRRNT